ncbi:hypothetical protein BKA93DRAFT_760054 [Sparassis latifolia]|uniref:Uncharacterized protein n=1 Tax=Sparassis crispa TaxID=139825 RepID=A0A401GMI8_9APHY|nr:hypothetical protein SCP_0504740 [Sparassis crispa]GBE83426.1 hypothetical protein SCP_0504740 [Sparassis crispa]
MYKLIRRISSSFFPHPDQSFTDADTSSAPQIGRKRRLSTTEPDEPSSSAKKQKSEPDDASDTASDTTDTPSQPTKETQDVKEVTKGVRDVELEEKAASVSSADDEAAGVPLPDSPVLKATEVSQEVEEEPLEREPLEEDAPSKEPVHTDIDEEDRKENIPPSEQATATEVGKEETLHADVQSDEEEIPGFPSTAGVAAVIEAGKVADEVAVSKRKDSTDALTSKPST